LSHSASEAEIPMRIEIDLIDQLDSQSLIVYFSDDSFVTLTVEELISAFRERFHMEAVGDRTKVN
jgi:hypothetical protein